jgi:hypothetical protein
MAKDWEWQEGKAYSTDDDGDKHESSVEYHVANEDSVGSEVQTLTGVHRLAPGEVVVKNPGDNQGRHDVLTKDQWNSTEYGSGDVKETDSGQDDKASASTLPPKPPVRK